MLRKTPKAKGPPSDFDNLVENAIDFFNRSIDEFQAKNFKYSVIHCCSAIELFLKSRLMLEHWTLILEKPEEADIKRFRQGDFKSVAMEGAIERLRSIAGETFLPDHPETFNAIRKHRNQLVHFHHHDYVSPKDSDTQEQVAIEQCKVWFSLSYLLGSSWRSHFKNYSQHLEKLNKRMHDVRAFLKVKYDRIKADVEEKQKKGIAFSTCDACGYFACEITPVLKPLFSSKCLVCNVADRYLYVDCSNEECTKKLVIEDGFGENQCHDCEATISIDQLADIVDPDGEHPSKDDPMPTRFHCADCGSYEDSVVELTAGKYLCVGCLSINTKLGQCDYCGDYIAGFDSEGSGLYGCTVCDGRDFDKD